MQNNNLSNFTESIPFINKYPSRPSKLQICQILKDCKPLCAAWLPIFISSIMQGLVFVVNVILLGQLGSKTLAAGGLSGFIVSSTGVAPLLGFITAQDTLCAQAFTGSSSRFACGLLLQKTVVMLLIMFAPISIVWCNIKPFIRYAIQDGEIVAITQNLLRYYSICVPIIFVSESIKKYLQSQRIFKAGVYVSSLTTILHIFFATVLSLPRFLNYGYKGVVLSFMWTSITGLVLLILYIKHVDGYQCWGGFEPKKWLKDTKPFFKLGLSGALIAAGEMAPSEVVSFASSVLGPKYLSAQASLGSINFMVIMCYNSLSIISTIFIGNRIGAGSVLGGKRIAHATFLLFSSFYVVLFVLINLFKGNIARIFSSDVVIQRMITSILPFVTFCQFFLGLANVCSGVLKGQARQHISALFKFSSAYVVAIPLSVSLIMFTDLKLLGLWAGLLGSWVISSLGELFYVWNFKWESLKAVC